MFVGNIKSEHGISPFLSSLDIERAFNMCENLIGSELRQLCLPTSKQSVARVLPGR